ncbi:MAG: SDR family oxidoreductase [Acidobacteria bacterium]|nr:SDR family oxidoreductase [Acidobacteriota bacterium]
MNPWLGNWALVTGASAGIGAEIANQLAAGGTRLVLTARRKDRLDELADGLRDRFSIRTECFSADLTRPEAAAEIFAFTQEKRLPIHLLVNNAGFGTYGKYSEIPMQGQLEMVQVNIIAMMQLTRLFLPQMIERHAGDILILSSTAAFQAVPRLTTYAATKAFDLLFAEGLAEELDGTGVRVCALCPGPTDTEFKQVSKQPDRAFRVAELPAKVARVGLHALAHNKSYVISGFQNFMVAHGERLMPRRVVTRMAGKMFEPEKK